MTLTKEIKDLISEAQKNAIDLPKTPLEQVQAVIDGKLIIGIYTAITLNDIQSKMDEDINNDVNETSNKIMSLIESNASVLNCKYEEDNKVIDIDDNYFCDCFKGRNVNGFMLIVFRKENRRFFDAFNEICRLDNGEVESYQLKMAAQKIRGVKVVDNLN